MDDTHPTVTEETPLLALARSSPPCKNQRRKPNPLPKLQISIILLLQVCEPIASSSIYPYINQLVSELDITGGDERKVGYYAGLLESLFFTAEAITVLQWSRISDYIGRKPVLLTGLIGTALSMLCFGLSTTFWSLAISRCLCGFLNGNIGVMKSVMGELTDSTNRAEGFALVPVAWATGATLGPLIGGALSRPHDRFPHIFKSRFWTHYPYFLPCFASALFVFVSIIIAACFFKETVPLRKTEKSKSPEASEYTSLHDSKSDCPVALRDLLIYPVVISISNYVALAFLDISLNALLPLFLAMPLEIGGLGLNPAKIGYIIGVYGAFNGLYQAFFFSTIVRRLGERRMFIVGMMTFIPIFLLFPAVSIVARHDGVTPFVWFLVGCILFFMLLMDMAYGSISIYITASAPNKRSLGATNGMSQTTVSVARAIGPAMSTSLFSFSVQKNIMGGYSVYVIFAVLSCLALLLAVRLPHQMWEEECENSGEANRVL